MTPEMIGVVITAGCGLVGGGVAWGVNSNTVAAIKNELRDVWKWRDAHERETADFRDKYQAALSELKGAQMVTGEQYKNILTLLTKIEQRLSELENQKGRN